MSGGTLHLAGLPGGPTTTGTFLLINGDNPSDDVDHDGYAAPGTCNYNNIYIPQSFLQNLVNVDNPALAIPAQNIVIANLPRALPSGTSGFVSAYVTIPPGTPAGRYIGSFQVRDSLILARGAANNINTTLNVDQVFIEVTVSPQLSFAIVNPDSAALLDSVIIRGNAGERSSGVLRVANTGNAPLRNVQVTASDLRSESAVGIVIPAENITVSSASFSSLALADTQRVTVTVNIPRGVLGGRYRGTLLVQAEGAPPQSIPLVVIVTSSRGILFENNPVRNSNGVARIAFNGDPGTDYKVGIFDMNGLLVFNTEGTVFAGLTATGTPGTAESPAPGADFAVSVTWPLVNERGEGAASGTYLVVVESIVNGQRQLARDKLIVIR